MTPRPLSEAFEGASLADRYRVCRYYGLTAQAALFTARRSATREKWGDELRAFWRRDDHNRRSEQRRRVALNARGVDRVVEIAEQYGVTVREYIEALLHYAISCDERPGSWEAQGFNFNNYRDDGFADRWF